MENSKSVRKILASQGWTLSSELDRFFDGVSEEEGQAAFAKYLEGLQCWELAKFVRSLLGSAVECKQ
jgi:hypothetical protein